jgi:hypothetical protein
MANSLWATAVRSGLAAERPTNPDVPDHTFAFFYATDTNTLTLWSGSAWVNPATLFTVALATTAGAIPAVTFANLPTPAIGKMVLVTDAFAAYAKYATVAAGAGAYKVPAIYDGTNWVAF